MIQVLQNFAILKLTTKANILKIVPIIDTIVFSKLMSLKSLIDHYEAAKRADER